MGKAFTVVLSIPLATFGCTEVSPMDRLQEALKEERPLALRISVALPYRPCESQDPVRDSVLCQSLSGLSTDTLSPLLRAKLSRELIELHARDLAHLLVAISVEEVDQVIASLLAKREYLANPRALNDLAVAYGVRSDLAGDPRDVLRALSRIRQALEFEPGLAEAAFNQALLLEQLGLNAAALGAWQSYLERHREAGWATEATYRRMRLAQELRRNEVGAVFEQAARTGDRSRAKRLAYTNPQAAFEYSLEFLARSESLGSSERRDLLEIVHDIGSALADMGSDCTLSAILDQASEALAEGTKSYVEARRLLQEGDFVAAGIRLELAHELLPPAHPLQGWIRMGEATIAFYDEDYDLAARGFRRLLDEGESTCLHALTGRARWGLGLTRLRQGRFYEAREQLNKAEGKFLDAKHEHNRGAVLSLLAETQGYMGLHRQAWATRSRAFDLLSRFPHSLRYHNLLFESATAALAELGTDAALILQNQAVAAAREVGRPERLAEALLWRSRIYQASGAYGEADTDLREIRQLLESARDVEMSRQVRTDLLVREAISTARIDLSAAIHTISGVVATYREQGRVLDLAEAEFLRARFFIRNSQFARAQEDLLSTVQRFEARRFESSSREERWAYAETVQEVFDLLIRLSVEDFGEPMKGLEFIERSRRFGSTNGRPVDVFGAEPSSFFAPAGSAVIVYAIVDDELYRWTIGNRGVDFDSQPLDIESLEAAISRLVSHHVPREERRRTAKYLYELLVPQQLDSPQYLWIVPDKHLNQLPFWTLLDPVSEELLSERYALALMPSLPRSADSLTFSAIDLRQADNLLVVGQVAPAAGAPEGQPSLPGVEQEIEVLTSLYRDTLVLDETTATWDRVLKALRRVRIFHYAGHAFVNTWQPELSYLPLAPSTDEEPKALFAKDIARQPLANLDLVVLSACNSAATTSSRVSGVNGLARAFLDAGARAVLATIQPVDDKVAVNLLARFHQLASRGFPLPTALTAAQYSTRADLAPNDLPAGTWGAFQLWMSPTTHSN